MDDTSWFRQWAGHPEPDWDAYTIHDNPVGYGYEVTDGSQIRDASWLNPFHQAILAAHARQYSEIPRPAEPAIIHPTRVQYSGDPVYYKTLSGFEIQDALMSRYGACKARLSAYTAAVSRCDNEGVKRHHHSPSDVVTLRWYDVDSGDRWVRRCCVWKYTEDDDKTRRVWWGDKAWVTRGIAIYNSGMYELGQRRPGTYQTHTEHTFARTDFFEDAVYAVHFGHPGWRPDHNGITPGTVTDLRALKLADGRMAVRDPDVMDRTLNQTPDLELWKQLSESNQDNPKTPNISAAIEHIVFTRMRDLLGDLRQLEGQK